MDRTGVPSTHLHWTRRKRALQLRRIDVMGTVGIMRYSVCNWICGDEDLGSSATQAIGFADELGMTTLSIPMDAHQRNIEEADPPAVLAGVGERLLLLQSSDLDK
jgi:hypothetical protein